MKLARKQKAKWSFVELTIGGRSLDPEKLSKVLGMPPDSYGKRGEPDSPNSKRKCKAGFWSLESDQWNWRLETQMESILKRITPVKEKLRRFLKENASVERAYLLIAISPPGGHTSIHYGFPSDLIAAFASLGFDIVFAIYFYDTPVSGEGKNGK
jgi:hypothetical protein